MTDTQLTTPEVDSSLAGKYLSFLLSGEEYGVPILDVREIIAYQDVTPLPRMPAYIRGVINLRGRIIPVVDLRLKLGMQAPEKTNMTCIVVLEVDSTGDGELAQIGCVVDTVNEVLDIKAEYLEAPPRFLGAMSTDFILAMGKIPQKDRVVALLEVEKVLVSQEVLELADGGESGREAA